ncbi:MAG: GlcNAc-PI de-N-acetylase [Chloroflexi bacterium]|jgi:LmbE family N-acetylglucosaminyl deacetylase|nr:PIG-L family deacetylase [Anaerolineaceae bacterium]NLI43952.1 GlcNAc-PI de-N-acetylase [Chloroflexota bacterium]HOE35521.1 PIG-L family deacetylase [Anaerolineaceae bacterium]HOT26180.1 PIG-L family deacetylase [Anaerolineaceae bacterium]HQK03616.1 PIG-L family deacetylase [Anaerolineaceae bacterium]
MRNARLKSPVKILAVLAHPDDEAFGMGGTLAHYARHGAEVNLICATLGEAGVVEPGYLSNGQTVAELRGQELRCSADALGLKEVILLGYRDSGMQGSPDNSHPNALAAQNLDDVVQKIEAHMRALQPDIVLTFDPFGGYGHPDHVRIHEAATLAFLKIRSEMPAEARRPFSRLYYHVMPAGFLRAAIFMMRLKGLDPRKAGANEDIDLVAISSNRYQTHARVHYRDSADAQKSAIACHASQGGTQRAKGFSALVERLFMPRVDNFIQAFPPPKPRAGRARGLLQGLGE